MVSIEAKQDGHDGQRRQGLGMSGKQLRMAPGPKKFQLNALKAFYYIACAKCSFVSLSFLALLAISPAAASDINLFCSGIRNTHIVKPGATSDVKVVAVKIEVLIRGSSVILHTEAPEELTRHGSVVATPRTYIFEFLDSENNGKVLKDENSIDRFTGVFSQSYSIVLPTEYIIDISQKTICKKSKIQEQKL